MYTSEDLKTMQAWSLEKKIMVSQAKIIEWYQKNEGNVYVSFSGGKDSTVLLDMVRKLYPEVSAVFIDTGLEYPEIRQFVKTVPNVVWLKPEMNFRDVIKKYGYPLISKEVAHKISSARNRPNCVVATHFEEGNAHDQKYGKAFSVVKWKWLKDSDVPISHKCCDIMKKKPANLYEKKTGAKPIVGTMACESLVRKTQWMRFGCNSFNYRPMSKPMSFWTEQDVLKYLDVMQIKYAPIYGDIIKKRQCLLHYWSSTNGVCVLWIWMPCRKRT